MYVHEGRLRRLPEPRRLGQGRRRRGGPDQQQRRHQGAVRRHGPLLHPVTDETRRHQDRLVYRR